MSFVYLFNKENTDYYKIGVSTNPKRRIKQCQTGNEQKLIMIKKFYSKHPYKLEKMLHGFFFKEHSLNEWFYLTQGQVDNFLIQCDKFESNILFLERENYFFQKELNR